MTDKDMLVALITIKRQIKSASAKAYISQLESKLKSSAVTIPDRSTIPLQGQKKGV